MTRRTRLFRFAGIFTLFLIGLLAMGGSAQVALAQTSPIHPTFPLLDENGQNVLDSGAPVSTMATCGSCHDTEFIADHSFHVTVGLDQFTAPGAIEGSHPWEMSSGMFGGWDATAYRYLTPPGDQEFDLGVPDWIKTYGLRHVGGGPAMETPDGTPLTELTVTAGDPWTHSYDSETGELMAWDWSKSGVEEMNCFLCHFPQPNNQARKDALESGEFQWANTATLLGTGIVSHEGDEWVWNPDAFQEDGELDADHVTIQDPTPENCGACHGAVHMSTDPLTPAEITPDDWHTIRTGQIFSGQRLKDTGLNLENKQDLDRSLDVHAERNVECSDCHFAVNNPVYYQEPLETRPGHLLFDPRRLDFGEYLLRPDHNFARGQTAQHAVKPEYQDAMRRCESCHDAESTHDWLPYTELHMDTLSCESCHIPKLYAPAMQLDDWTVITPDGQANVTFRGVEGDVNDIHSLITGYEPVLLEQTEVTGESRLTPFNLITTYYWVHEDPERPVRVEDLKAVYLNEAGDDYAPEIITAFDANGDGTVDSAELRLDSDEKVQMIKDRLVGLGLTNPQIRGEVRPYNVNHNVAHGDYATKDCQVCHSQDSLISRSFVLAAYRPGGVDPTIKGDNNVKFTGDMAWDDETNTLTFTPATTESGLYLPGHNHVDWVGWIGLFSLLATLAFVVIHGGLRLYEAGKHAHDPHKEPEMRTVYMYTFYERAWHWLQAITILMLLATGIVIHRPDTFGNLDFGIVVPAHNVLAAILLINAVFAVFYHFASGEIRQYLPEPRGYFRQALMQVDYYMRGIFRGDPHPFAKTPEHKLNPLQQATYFMILNVLLPLQILTGIAMWSAMRWPNVMRSLGGLTWLAPFHTLIAWFFASFVILHVYLTTTGHTPLEGIKAMTVGWEEVEVEGREGTAVADSSAAGAGSVGA